MKKILTLFAVLSMAMASMAGHLPAQAFQKAVNPRMARPTRTEQVLAPLPGLQAPSAAMKAPAAALSDTTLNMDSVKVTYYSSSYYSSTGKYDYYFVFSNKTDSYPLLYLDLYLPTDTGLVGGYYTSEDSAIDLSSLVLCLDYYDYYYAYYGYSNYTFTDAILQIDDNGDGTWTFTVILTDNSGNTYEFELTQAVACGTSTYDPSDDDDDWDWDDWYDDDEDTSSAYSYDESSNVTKTYTASDDITITDYVSKYGCIYFEAEAANGSDACALEFIVSAADANTVIPAGTYTIDDSEANGTVLASSGYDGTYIYDAYYVTLVDYSGTSYADEVWFIVSGSVTVTAQNNQLTKIVVNGVNSLGNTVNITYDATITALDNVASDDASVRKVMENGQLYIIRDGVRYNALGNQVD